MIKWKCILGSNQFVGVKQMYTVAFLQDFSVPLMCWCALEITSGALAGLCIICRPTSHSHSSEGTSALLSS